MAKGIYSQGVCMLTNGRTTLGDVKAVLEKEGYKIVKENKANDHWQFSGAALLVPYKSDVNGYVAIDLVNKRWPDAMGDPKADLHTFSAWSMGHFGPWTFPNGLQRAGQHAWAWDAAASTVEKHAGFIRIRLSYAFGAKEDSPVLPQHYDPIDEMNFVSRLVLAIFKSPGILCYFNPNGEVLRDRDDFSKNLAEHVADKSVPLPLWSNIRFFNLSDQLAFMDTVGNSQLDAMDIEAIFPAKSYQPQVIYNYLRDVSLYVIESKPKFVTGESIDGPQETNLSWLLEVHENGLTSPPREVLRVYPRKNKDSVLEAVADLESEND